MPDLAALITEHPLRPLLVRAGEVAAAEGIEAYAVGGLVRDVLLGHPTTDVDVVTVGAGTGLRLAEAVRSALGARRVHVYERFGTAAIRLPEKHGGHVVEFVAARRESYRRDSRKPDVEAGTLGEDLARRDFTVNALALDLHPARFGRLLDPFEGVQDLAAGRLRTPIDPLVTFDDDPLRMVRAARFAARLGFTVAPEIVDAMHARTDRIAIVSPERIADELQKLIAADTPSTGFRVLFEGRLLPHILPELDALAGVEAVDGVGHKDNFFHTIQVLDNLVAAVRDRPVEETRSLRWAALLHDVGKARTKRFRRGRGWTFYHHEEESARLVPVVFERLRLPRDARMDTVQALVRLHHRPHALVDEGVTDSAVRRLLFDAGDLVDDLMTLVRADLTTKNPGRKRRYLAGFDRVEEKMASVEARDHVRYFQPPVDGVEIMAALGVSEGLAVGLLKERLKEAVLDGEVPNEHDAAWAFVQQHAPDALRRGRLFDRLRTELAPAERRALGTLRDALATAPLPDDDTAAWAMLMDVKSQALDGERRAEMTDSRRKDDG
jgi:poly(A) polymerase